jgi:hypothetical protein
VRAITQPKHLNAPIREAVMNNNVALGVNGNATGTLELPCAASLAADAANVSPVPVPQHLHTMIVKINYNKVTQAIKRNALGIIELAVTCTPAADAAQMQPVPVPQHLDAIAAVTHNKVALIIKRNITAASELPVVAAPAAHAADVRAIAEPKNLKTAVTTAVVHNDVALRINGTTGGTKIELPSAAALAAEAQHEAPVRVKHLHPPVFSVNHEDVARPVYRQPPWKIKLARARPFAAEAPQHLDLSASIIKLPSPP